MSILINNNKILGLMAQINDLAASTSGVDGVRRSGGIISGVFEVDGDVDIQGDLILEDSNFYIDTENNRLGINIQTPSGNLHIYNEDGDAHFKFDSSGVNGFKFVYNGAYDYDGGDYHMKGDVNHQNSGYFVFDSYFDDEYRVYEAIGFDSIIGTYFLYDSVYNDRPSYTLDSDLYYDDGKWNLGEIGAVSPYYSSDSTGFYPPKDGWYSVNVNFPNAGLVREVTASNVQFSNQDSSLMTVKLNSVSFNSNLGVAGVVIEDVNCEVEAGEEALISQCSTSDFSGAVVNAVIKNYERAKVSSFNIGWNDESVVQKTSEEQCVTSPTQLSDVYFRANFTSSGVNIYLVNDSGQRIVAGGSSKKLPKSL